MLLLSEEDLCDAEGNRQNRRRLSNARSDRSTVACRLQDELAWLDISRGQAFYPYPRDERVYHLWRSAIVEIRTEDIHIVYTARCTYKPGRADSQFFPGEAHLDLNSVGPSQRHSLGNDLRDYSFRTLRCGRYRFFHSGSTPILCHAST